MARSDSFFIRAKLSGLTGGAGGFTTENIDLGSFVDALGKTVLRIHNVSVQYTYGANVTPAMDESPKFITKKCRTCGWESHPTIVPEVISDRG